MGGVYERWESESVSCSVVSYSCYSMDCSPPGSCLWNSPGKNTGVMPCPPPGDLPNTGTEPTSLMSPALAGGFFTSSATWEGQTFSRFLNRNQRPLGGVTGYTSECLKPLLRRECMEKQERALKCLGCWTKFGITLSESEGE